jgi:CheY-like chemotaxis protein
MDGAELAQLVRTRLPAAAVVIMSGYSAAEVTERVAEGATHGFLAKPFTPKALVATLQRALAAARSSP